MLKNRLFSLFAQRFYSAGQAPIPLKSASGGNKWATIPQVRVRSAATNRLFISRYLERKTNGALRAADNGTKTNAEEGMNEPVLIPKRMKDSLVEEFLPFKSDPQVLEDYINPYGTIRFGKVLEDLDALAGSIAYIHADDARDDTPPLTIVTASADRIDLIRPIPVNEDVSLSGFVTYVGTSSMEISIKMETVPGGIPRDLLNNETDNFENETTLRIRGEPILVAKFTMVARNPHTHKAAPVNPLQLETEEERRLFKLGHEHKQRKKEAAQISLAKIPPCANEMAKIHDLYLEYIKYIDPTYHIPKPKSVVWMKDTIQQTLVLCMPQDRNIHNNIFGGYLMRLAYELAYSTTILYTHSPIHFLSLDDILFRKPVPIGSILSLTSQIVYTTSTTLQVKVRADIINPRSEEREHAKELSNEFWFRFESRKGEIVKRVMPRSYDESIRYLEGSRRELGAVTAGKFNTSFLGSHDITSS